MVDCRTNGRPQKPQQKIRRHASFFTIVSLLGMYFTARLNLLVLQTSSWPPKAVVRTTPNADVDREPFLQLLRYAKIKLPEKDIKYLPRWRDVETMFGKTPRVLGLERCNAYRSSIPNPLDRMIAPAGIFNSGTNLLYELLANNCQVHPFYKDALSRSKVGVHWQVNWGKHQPARYRFNHSVTELINNSNILPIVIGRDLWTWAASMCRVNYAAIWFHVTGPEGHCPNFVPNDVERAWYRKTEQQVKLYYDGDVNRVRNVMLKANFSLADRTVPVNVRYKTQVNRYPTLVHFWKDWHDEYYDADFPRLMLRLEDLVFRPYETLKQVCECVDGKFASPDGFQLKGESTKKFKRGAHARTQQTNLLSAFSVHLQSNRTAGATSADLLLARNVLNRSKAHRFFDYKWPI